MAPGKQTNGSKTNNIITAVPFLLITPDARAGAMGEAGVAVLPDVNAMSINPSKLAFLDHPYGFSMAYSPWLNNLNSNINLAYLSGFYKIDSRNTVGASLRYFSIGEVQLLDVNNQDLGLYNPNEFALDATFARKFSDSFSLGTAVRYIRSSLASGQFSSGQQTKPGSALAVDVSAYVKNPTVIFNTDAIFAFGLCIANIGTKMSYTGAGNKYFLPTNLKVGTAATFLASDLHEFTLALDFNKLLVPTQPEYDANGQILRGKDPNVSVPEGIFRSFNDAPDGFSEELKEISISTGAEYRYNKQFAARVGYFYESPQKGDRNYFTVGAGLCYQTFNIDVAYLVTNSTSSPLANTLRFTLMWNFNKTSN
ncbi:type IX secretion system outer membrane channel protein PorV [Pedobacter polaris]|uniref:type IX secretion system outer membrane channel protein PorV n=1 Tax=Pedobacter polaris TaxID=2571273 RepID=UPI001CECC2B0|nr:type IX secretion system outer membrane channel protein PorV [Pedobacter polaris]